jgi:TusA-related sulfurtransferase
MIELDIRGKVCPDATSEVYAALHRLAEGEALRVISDYPPVRQTVPALARQFGRETEVREGEGRQFAVVIGKAVAVPPA